MILFNLKCSRGHVFEAWFRDNATYESQTESGEVSCPSCGTRKVEKAVMAPRLAKGQQRERAAAVDALPAALDKLRQHVEATCDYVGPAFPEEARKIHYGETEARDIYGEASDGEAKEMADEGIAFSKLPLPPRRDA